MPEGDDQFGMAGDATIRVSARMTPLLVLVAAILLTAMMTSAL